MAQMYGNIINDVEPNLAGVAVPHGLQTANYCVFGTQRIGANVKVEPRLYAADGMTRTAMAVRVYDGSAPGPGTETTMDILVVSEHSLVDIGPVVVGATRNAVTQVRNNRRAYRSLHTQVPFTGLIGKIEGTVDVIHRLNSDDVLKFVFPNADPWDAGDGGAASSLHFWCTLGGNANTIVVHVARQDGAAFSADMDAITVDVMVMTGTQVGHSMPLVPMFTSLGVPGAAGDYVAGDRPSLTHSPSYWAAYHPLNVLGGGAVDYQHNLLTAPTMVLIGPVTTQGAPMGTNSAFVGAWTPNVADPTRDFDLRDSGTGHVGLVGNCVLVLSPYSPLAVAYP